MSTYLRLRRVIGLYGPTLVGLLAVIGLLAGGSAWYVYASPPTETVNEEVDAVTVGSVVETRAVVTSDTPLYERGTNLTDKSLYLLTVSPNMTFTGRTTVPTDGEARVTTRLSIDMAAEYDGEAFWEERRTIVESRRRTEQGTVTASQTVNMSALNRYVQRRREATDNIGTFSADLRLNVTYRAGEYEGQLTANAPLVFTGNGYLVDGEVAAERTHSRTVTRTEVGQSDPLVYGSLAVVALLALGLAGAIGVEYRRGIDLQTIEDRLVRERHAEWISRGELPTSDEVRHVEIDTLADLVDIAISSNKSVIHDVEYDAYAVVDGDVTYFYAAGDVRVETWLDV